MNYAKFHGKTIDELCTHNKEKSYYCHNYYIDEDGNEIVEWSDDDNLLLYSTDDGVFADSSYNDDGVMYVFPEFR